MLQEPKVLACENVTLRYNSIRLKKSNNPEYIKHFLGFYLCSVHMAKWLAIKSNILDKLYTFSDSLYLILALYEQGYYNSGPCMYNNK